MSIFKFARIPLLIVTLMLAGEVAAQDMAALMAQGRARMQAGDLLGAAEIAGKMCDMGSAPSCEGEAVLRQNVAAKIMAQTSATNINNTQSSCGGLLTLDEKCVEPLRAAIQAISPACQRAEKRGEAGPKVKSVCSARNRMIARLELIQDPSLLMGRAENTSGGDAEDQPSAGQPTIRPAPPQATASSASPVRTAVGPGCTGAVEALVADSQQPGALSNQAQAHHFAARYRQVADGPCAGDPRRASLLGRATSLDASAAQLPTQYAQPAAPTTVYVPPVERRGPSLAELEQRSADARANAEALRQLEASEAQIRQARQKRAAEAAARQARKDTKQRQREDYARQQNEPSRKLGQLLELRRQQDNAERARVAPEVSNPNAVRTEVLPALGGRTPFIRAHNLISVPLRITIRYQVRWPDGYDETGEKTCTSPARQFCDVLLAHAYPGDGHWTANVLATRWVDARY